MVAHRISHFLDAQRGILQKILCLGHADRSKQSLEWLAGLRFKKMLEAGWAEAKPRGEDFHR
jgi:hypothetical protein